MKFNINDIIHVLKSEGVVHEEDIITGAPRIKKKVSYIEIDEDHDDDDIVYYTVERICRRQVVNRKVMYLIKWEGYDESENTWEFYSELKEDKLVVRLTREWHRMVKTKPIKKED